MEDFPYEMLYEIFTYVPVDELYFKLGSVCRKWKDVVLDKRLWRRKRYCPRAKTTDEEIVCLLFDVQVLEMFDAYECTVGTQVFSALSTNSSYLTEVILSPKQALDPSDLEKLLMVTNLNILSLHIDDNEMAKNNFKMLGEFHSLKKLTLSGVFCYRIGVTMALATGCKRLQELNLGCLSCNGITSAVDIAAILKWKGVQLVSFTFTCQLLSPHLTDLIGRCAKLQELHMNIYQSWVFVDFSPLLILKNLKAFSVIGHLNSNPSLEHLFAHLEWDDLKYLNLTVSEGNVTDIMFHNCSKLRSLRLEGNDEVKVALTNIHRLSDLEELTLAYWTSPFDETLLYISQLKNLKKLCFEHCPELRDADILDLVLCHDLETVTLNRCCGILGYNFRLIADELKCLTLLNFFECENLKDFQVIQLQKLFPYLTINVNNIKQNLS